MIIYTGHNMQAPRTPPRGSNQKDVGDLDFNDLFGKKNGAKNDTPERDTSTPHLMTNRKQIGTTTGKPPADFNQYLAKIAEAEGSNKKGGKTRKRKTRKTRSRKHKKSHKKSHKKKSHKKTNRKSKKSRK